MANPHQLLSGNSAFGRLLGAASPVPTRSPTPAVDYPQAFMAEQLALARSSLGLNSCDLSNFSQHTLSGLIALETVILTLLSLLARGLVAVSHELSGVTQKLTSISEEKKALKEELHDLSSQIANLLRPHTPPPNQDLSALQSAIRDLSHCVTTPAPQLPQAPTPTPQPQASARPPLTRKGKEKVRGPPSPPHTLHEDAKYLIPYDDTKLGRAFGYLVRYAQLVPHLYEAEGSGEGLMISAPSPLATSTLITPPSLPPILWLPLAQTRAVNQRKLPSPHALNRLQGPLPPWLRRGRHPSQVHKDFSSLPAIPQPLIQTPLPSQQNSQTWPLAFLANPTAFSRCGAPH